MNCRIDTPLCQLGLIQDVKLKPKSICIQGCSAWEVTVKTRAPLPPEQKYSIFVLGEAPGREEDEKDIPFVGEAGDTLVQFLEKSQFPIDQTWVDNLVRCRPPKNRRPAREEIQACRPYLLEKLKEHQPKVIVLLGATALGLFNIKDGGVTKNRGKVFRQRLPDWEDGPEFIVIPTFHPAYFCYRDNPQQRRLVEGDFRLAAALALGEDAKPSAYQAKYTVCLTVDAVKLAVDTLRAHGRFAFDTESPNLHLMKSPMILLQLSGGLGKTFLVPLYRHDPDGVDWKLRSQFANDERAEVQSLLQSLFHDRAVTRIAINLKYDANVLRRWLDIDALQGDYHDLAVMHHLIYEYPPHDLESLADMQCGSGDYSYKVREIVGHGRELVHTYDHIPDPILWDYGANDAELTYRVFEEWLEPDLRAKPRLWRLYCEESLPAIKALRKGEWLGNKVDLGKVDEMERLYKDRLNEALVDCRRWSPTPEFSPGSPDQVAEVLRSLGFEKQITDESKASGQSTAKDVLLEIDHPFAEAVLRHRKYGKLLSTYVDRIRADIDEQHRIRYQFKVHGTASGRLSARLLHQIPRIDKEAVLKEETVLREIFIEDDGLDIVYLDWTQLELFVFAYLSGEEELIRVLEEGRDVHRFTASSALDIPLDLVSDFNRSNVGKPLNFGVIYGSEGGQIAKCQFENPRTGKREVVGNHRAHEFVRNFRAKHRNVDAYLKRTINLTQWNNNVFTTVFGREKRAFGLNNSQEARNKKLQREITNFSIQSPAGAIAIRTINLIDDLLELHHVGLDRVRLLNTVHDSISYGVKKSLTSWFVSVAKQIAERPIPQIQNKPFRVKIGVGKSWAEAEMNAA